VLVRSRPRKRKRTSALWSAATASAAVLAAITLSSDQQVTRASAAAPGQPAVTAATTTTPSAAQTTTPRPTKQGAGRSTIFIDPDTGLQRDPTPEELLELSNQRTVAAEAPEPIVTETGFSGLRLSDDQMMFTVATKRADGTIGVDHAVGKKAADQKVRDAAKGGLVAGKERVVER
jgi:hypothetical protein